MRYARNWLAIGVAIACFATPAASAGEPVETPEAVSARLNPYVIREPLFKTPDIPPVKPPPRGGYVRAARSHVLGPVAKLRRARFTLSKIRQLKAERGSSLR